MIRNQWYVILESKEVDRKPRKFRRMGESLVLWRDQEGKVACLVDRCCHRGVALSAGKIVQGKVQCPFHGLEYDGSGACTCIPANSRIAAVPDNCRVPAYPVHEEHGWIWIWWGDAGTGRSPDTQPGDEVSTLAHNAGITQPESTPLYFPDIDGHFSMATVKDPWNTHYSRVLENQLDVVHLPFVHHNTIGRGNRTVVDGPGVEWIDGRMLYTYVFNRVDDGTPPRTPREVPVPPPDSDFKIELIMPNLWENRISGKLRIVAAFVPVDEEHTVLYLRTYQRILQVPVFRSLFNRMMCRSNLFIAHQDRRVVQTQVPRRSALRGGEQLIQGDLPIIEYRRKRDELLDAAAGERR
ncbi:MAG: aromatic ring-hydroxylating dioxygenase subunit alpha [Spirochaetales bacterium]|nr:aromatic ring-hydroxylating dioxygenase subunit alpha [Spirochaetales bacterium]